MMLPDFLTADQVARLLGMDGAASFLRARQALEDDHGFPLPMPMPLRNRRWRADQVQAWLAEQGRPRAMAIPPRPMGPNVVLMEKARSA